MEQAPGAGMDSSATCGRRRSAAGRPPGRCA